MKHMTLTCLLGLGLLWPAASVVADEAPQKTTHVVELFTSQGCSSCPPSNRRVSLVAQEPGVLALSYGVTYWDYLGWKDTFGDPKFTDRQRDYREALNGANLYTPQIVLNGSAHSPKYSVKDMLSMPLSDTDAAPQLWWEKGQFFVTSNLPAGGAVAVVSYTPGLQDVAVKAGENGGRTLSLTNVVTDIEIVEWTGKPVSVPLSRNDGQSYAALFHAPETAKILAVATYAP
ncbi:DUF1223 domain-containing protein [Litorimonas sp. RW-G-Af-16]|uniref:DUF1223 domain-containing protein n=1 Tax=Litorimonas sp. RW-G-Af-16 TaxID=3241168 RepID=UPI00390CB070